MSSGIEVVDVSARNVRVFGEQSEKAIACRVRGQSFAGLDFVSPALVEQLVSHVGFHWTRSVVQDADSWLFLGQNLLTSDGKVVFLFTERCWQRLGSANHPRNCPRKKLHRSKKR